MKFMEKMWDNLGLFESSTPQEEEQPTKEEPGWKNRKLKSAAANTGGTANNVVSLPTAGQTAVSPLKQIKVMVVEPVSFDDSQSIADYLKAKKPVVVNLENTDAEITRRMVDFISGTTYALNGTIQKVGNHIFLCAPHNVDVAYTSKEEQKERPGLFWK